MLRGLLRVLHGLLLSLAPGSRWYGGHGILMVTGCVGGLEVDTAFFHCTAHCWGIVPLLLLRLVMRGQQHHIT